MMTDLQRDVLTALLSITGLFGFISGAFIISAAIFATVAILSNIHLTHRLQS